MDGLRKVEWLDPDGIIHAALTKEVDLDALMLELAAADPYDDGDFRWEGDHPTTIYGGGTHELWVGRWRCNPCVCGDDHAYDVVEADGKGLRGSWLGVMGNTYLPAWDAGATYPVTAGQSSWATWQGY